MHPREDGHPRGGRRGTNDWRFYPDPPPGFRLTVEEVAAGLGVSTERAQALVAAVARRRGSKAR